MQITKALIRLRGCAGWSAPELFANPLRQVFSRRGPFINLGESPIFRIPELKKFNLKSCNMLTKYQQI